jgi:hypothetical protein
MPQINVQSGTPVSISKYIVAQPKGGHSSMRYRIPIHSTIPQYSLVCLTATLWRFEQRSTPERRRFVSRLIPCIPRYDRIRWPSLSKHLSHVIRKGLRPLVRCKMSSITVQLIVNQVPEGFQPPKIVIGMQDFNVRRQGDGLINGRSTNDRGE